MSQLVADLRGDCLSLGGGVVGQVGPAAEPQGRPGPGRVVRGPGAGPRSRYRAGRPVVRALPDSCVLVERHHPRGDPAVKAAVDFIPDEDLPLGVLVVGETTGAVARLLGFSTGALTPAPRRSGR